MQCFLNQNRLSRRLQHGDFESVNTENFFAAIFPIKSEMHVIEMLNFVTCVTVQRIFCR
jgi:hypothetical protein